MKFRSATMSLAILFSPSIWSILLPYDKWQVENGNNLHLTATYQKCAFTCSEQFALPASPILSLSLVHLFLCYRHCHSMFHMHNNRISKQMLINWPCPKWSLAKGKVNKTTLKIIINNHVNGRYIDLLASITNSCRFNHQLVVFVCSYSNFDAIQYMRQ